MPPARFAELLGALAAGEVDFVVVGMTAGILHGAPVSTLDLDIVHARSADNVARLLRVLAGLELNTRWGERGLEEFRAMPQVRWRFADHWVVQAGVGAQASPAPWWPAVGLRLSGEL